MKKLKVKFRLWVETSSGKNVIGDGRWRLLEEIKNTGSLSKACKTLGISYRKAWGDLEKMQSALPIPLIEKHRGGTAGGETQLTPFGKKIVNAYRKLHKDIEKEIIRAGKYVRLNK